MTMPWQGIVDLRSRLRRYTFVYHLKAKPDMQFLRQYCFASPAEALELVEEPDSEPDTGEVVIAVDATPIHYGACVPGRPYRSSQR